VDTGALRQGCARMIRGRLELCRRVGLAIALAWAVGWSLFGFCSGIGEGHGWAGILAHLAFPGLVFLAGVAIARRWGFLGGAVLILEGFLAFFVYEPLRNIAGVIIMTLPPLLGGAMVWAHVFLRKDIPTVGRAGNFPS
jgi:hypothetical protein